MKRKILFFICLQLFCFTSIYGQISFDPQPSFFRNQREMPLMSLATKQDILVSNYGAIKNDGKDDLLALQAAFDAAKKLSSASNPVRVIFEKGLYDIMPTSILDQCLFLTSANNIVFEGNGSEISNHNPTIGFIQVNSCTNIIFKDLIFDYAMLPFTQGKVTAIDLANNSFTIKIDDGFPLLSESHFTSAPDKMSCIKDATGKLKTGANNLFPYRGWTQISGNIFKVNTPNRIYTSQVELGDYFVQIARDNSKNILSTLSSKNITYLNINVYSAPATSFGLISNFEVNIINCNVIPKPGSGSVQSVNADVIHSPGGAFGPWVQGCRFEAYTDDAVNLKYIGRNILAVVSPTVLKIRFRVRATDQLVIFNPRIGMPIATPTITKVTDLGNNIFDVTFDGSHNVTTVGTHQLADKVYFTNSANESAVFRNNLFKNGRRYGILFQSSYAQVKDCTFENLSSSGIKMQNQVDWGEGYIANNIEITNNSFINCGFDSTYIEDPNAAAISTVVSKLKAPCTTASIWCGTEAVQWQGLRNITITNNNFIYNKAGINIRNINGGIITGNTYTHNSQDKTLGLGVLPTNFINVNNSNLILDQLNNASFEENHIKLVINKNLLIVINENTDSQTYNLTLFDGLIRKIHAEKLNEKISTIDISAYQSGWYIVTLENEKIKISKKVIFQ